MTRAVPFSKVHGCANDFVLIDLTAEINTSRNAIISALDAERVRAICDRRRGIGADGVLILTDQAGSIHAEILNADGSSGGMCGNGLRCIALFLLRNGVVQAGHDLDIVMGGRRTSVRVERECPFCCSLDLGRVDVGMKGAGAALSDRDWALLTEVVEGLPCESAWVGNPHLVVFGDQQPIQPELEDVASRVRATGVFESGVNVSLAYVSGPGAVIAMTDERGVGPTQACASGAAAIVASGRRMGLLNDACSVAMPGGDLGVELLAGHEDPDAPRIARISGTAEIVFSGTLPLSAAGFEA